MENFAIGQQCCTWIGGILTKVEILAVRAPNTVVNWSSADQSKTVYKVRALDGVAAISRKYHVRQAAQLIEIVPSFSLDAPFHKAAQ